MCFFFVAIKALYLNTHTLSSNGAIYSHFFIHTHTHTHTHTHMLEHPPRHTHTHKHTHLHMHTHPPTYIHTLTPLTHTHLTHTLTHTHTHTLSHTLSHTHTAKVAQRSADGACLTGSCETVMPSYSVGRPTLPTPHLGTANLISQEHPP